MGLVSFKEVHDGRGSDLESSKRGTLRTYTRVWRARTNDPYDDGDVVVRGAPPIGSPYPWNYEARLKKLSPKNDPRSKFLWYVTGTYVTDREIQENPLADLVKSVWRTEKYQRPCLYDRNGNAVLNSAGEEFDPPVMEDDSRWAVHVTKNLAVVEQWILDYQDATNSDGFFLDGVWVEPNHAYMDAIEIGEWQQRNDIWYRALQMTIHLKRARPAPHSRVVRTYEGWTKWILDSGFTRWIYNPFTEREEGPFVCLTPDGKRPTKPQLLDGLGHQLDVPSTANAYFIPVDPPNPKPFSFLPLW